MLRLDFMPQEEYDAEQLDILAIAFTCVKVLYVGGAIERARRLVALLEPARQAFATPMHQTVIRNEAAFHGCIQQLLAQAPPRLPRPLNEDQPVIYLCGDSHCLPGALPYNALEKWYIRAILDNASSFHSSAPASLPLLSLALTCPVCLQGALIPELKA